MVFYSKFGENLVGCEILSINGVPFMDILDEMILYHYEGAGDDNTARTRLLMNGKFYNYFSYFYDIPPEVLHYELKDVNNKIFYVDVNMKNLSFVTEAKSDIAFGFYNSQAITYTIQNNVGYVIIPTFDSTSENVEKDFAAAVEALKESQVSGVVLDVRYNGGGDQSFRKILGYLTDHEITIANFRYRQSKLFYDLYALRPLTDNFRNSPNAVLPQEEGYTGWWSWVIKPSSERFLTTVPVVVVTNETIFSSTSDFVNACLTHELATVVGNAVPLSGFGLATPLVLPSGKYIIELPFQENVDHQQTPLENIVKEPQVQVDQTLSDFYKGKDTVTQKALDLLAK